MSAERVFVDTNVLVYAYDSEAGEKHDAARRWMEHLWETRSGALSVQVLQEFYVTMTRKIPRPLTRTEARARIEGLGRWRVVIPKVGDVLAASELEERHQISFWDALIVRAAVCAGASRLLTEDLNAGQRIEGVSIESPFA